MTFLRYARAGAEEIQNLANRLDEVQFSLPSDNEVELGERIKHLLAEAGRRKARLKTQSKVLSPGCSPMRLN